MQTRLQLTNFQTIVGLYVQYIVRASDGYNEQTGRYINQRTDFDGPLKFIITEFHCT